MSNFCFKEKTKNGLKTKYSLQLKKKTKQHFKGTHLGYLLGEIMSWKQCH